MSRTQSVLGAQIAAFILQTRLKKGYTQEYMAQQLDMHQATYSKLEKGSHDFSLAALEHIAALFEMSIPEFFFSALLGHEHFVDAVKNCLPIGHISQYKQAFERVKKELTFSGSRFVVLGLLMEWLKDLSASS